MRYREIISEKSTPSPLDNPRFRVWFGKSKVVDANGQPLRLHHGTGSDIHSFRGMVWGSISTSLATEYAHFRGGDGGEGSNVIPIYLRIENPLDADIGFTKTVTVGDFFSSALQQAVDNGLAVTNELRIRYKHLMSVISHGRSEEESGPHYGRHDFWNDVSSLFGKAGGEAVFAMYRLLGFDGIKMVEHGDTTYGAFSPSQVKSAISNTGHYGEDERIAEATDMIDSVRGHHHGQMDATISLIVDDDTAGFLEYSVYHGEPSIQMIDVPEGNRRKGYAARLVRHLQSLYPNAEIDWGMTTPEGEALRASLPYRVVVDPDVMAAQERLVALQSREKELQSIDAEFNRNPSEESRKAVANVSDEWNVLHDEIRGLKDELRGASAEKRIIKSF